MGMARRSSGRIVRAERKRSSAAGRSSRASPGSTSRCHRAGVPATLRGDAVIGAGTGAPPNGRNGRCAADASTRAAGLSCGLPGDKSAPLNKNR